MVDNLVMAGCFFCLLFWHSQLGTVFWSYFRTYRRNAKEGSGTDLLFRQKKEIVEMEREGFKKKKKKRSPGFKKQQRKFPGNPPCGTGTVPGERHLYAAASNLPSSVSGSHPLFHTATQRRRREEGRGEGRGGGWGFAVVAFLRNSDTVLASLSTCILVAINTIQFKSIWECLFSWTSAMTCKKRSM